MNFYCTVYVHFYFKEMLASEFYLVIQFEETTPSFLTEQWWRLKNAGQDIFERFFR